MAHEHRFASRLRWSGSTAAGRLSYRREHEVEIPPVDAGLTMTAAPAFRGDERYANPEQLVLAAASSCQLLSFLAVAAREGIDVRAYEDDAAAVVPVTREPMRISRIELRPRIVVAPGTEVAAVQRAVQQGHKECFVTNSLTSDITVEATIETDVG